MASTVKLNTLETRLLKQLIEHFELSPTFPITPDLLDAYKSIRFKFVGEQRSCLKCKKAFTAHRWDHKYCTGRCREAYLKTLQRHPELRGSAPEEVYSTV